MNTLKTRFGAGSLITVLSRLCILCTIMSGCGVEVTDGPPDIMLGESACAECGMIISDERFATVTVVDGTRGIQPILFDDFNCQQKFEHQYPDLLMTNRWSHDHSSLVWFETETGWFVKSSQVRSPMAAGMAFFHEREDAEAFAQSVSGQVLDFGTAWIQTKE